MDLKTSQNQYTISLDAIDLNFIPTISKYNGNKVTQIWTKKNLTRRDNEYYEFEIMDENEDDIPKIFIRDHLNSNKHKIFKKIINASLDRMKKVVSNEIVYEGKRKDESIYFCETCVTVVNTQEKISHENSARHRKSLAADKILNDFLDLYIDNNEFSEGTYEGSNISNCKNYNTLIRNNSGSSENNRNNTLCNQSTNYKIKESNYTNNSSQNQCDTLSEEKQTAALPVKNDNLKCFPVKEDGQKKEEVPILPCQVVLKRKGTHIKDNSFYCAICNMYVPNHNYNIYTHITSAKHVNNATKQAKEELIDVHYHMDLTKFPQLECFVCKKSLPLNNTHNVTKHTLGFLHQKNYKLVLSENKLILRNGKYICNFCYVVIVPMHELIHCQTSSHLGKLEDHKIRRYLLKNYLEQQLCLVCNVRVPKDLNTVYSHLTGKYHNEKYDTKLSENNIHSQGNDFKCELCDVIIPTGGEIQHIQTATHCANAGVNVTKEAPSTSSSSASTEDNMLRTYLLQNDGPDLKVCLVCYEVFLNNTNYIMSHLTEEVHNEKYNTKLSENKIRSQGNDFKCELCDVIVPTGDEIQHIKTATHCANAVVKVAKEAPSTSTSSTSISTEDNELRTYLLQKVDSEKKVCPLCNVHVPNNTNNIMSHLTEEVHNEKYNTKLTENKIHSQGNDFKCELCDVIIPTGGEIQHIQTATHHANAVGNVTKKAPSASTSSTSISTEDNKLRTYLLKNFDSDKNVCIVCNVYVRNNTNNIISHLTGNVHYEKYNTKLSENKIRSQGKHFRCELCDVIVPNSGEIQHIHTDTHCANVVMKVTKEEPSTSSSNITTDDNRLRTYLLRNFGSDKKFCIVCNVYVPNNTNNIISHLTGNVHYEKYNTKLSENKIRSQGKHFKCELCDVIVPNSGEIQHIHTDTHCANVVVNVTKKAPLISSSSISTEDNKLKTYLLKNDGPAKKVCLVCNVHVPNNTNNIISQLSGAHHNKQHENTLRNNEMYPQDNDYKCELCDVIVPTGSEIQHVMSESHKTGIAKRKHCVLC